jgi:hypothetical protein
LRRFSAALSVGCQNPGSETYATGYLKSSGLSKLRMFDSSVFGRIDVISLRIFVKCRSERG